VQYSVFSIAFQVILYSTLVQKNVGWEQGPGSITIMLDERASREGQVLTGTGFKNKIVRETS
jgi:hypothetical protein